MTSASDLITIFSDIIKENIPGDAWNWLYAQKNPANSYDLNLAFGIMPRKTGKTLVQITNQQQELINAAKPGLSINSWAVDRLSRVWLLAQYQADDQNTYFRTIENLFSAAEMNEQVALYSALPLISYPELWLKRCAEGIRSNIGIVLEAIMYHNPYPAENLPEPAWNQMVLKAFFTDKQINNIYGLDSRANTELARILIDYARERHAAGRQINDMLWYLVQKFVTEQQLNNMKQGHFND
ncbi:MAG: EboA domain-containing protein [Mucilaginibacter sp.]|uniref:EboA domain-containing protein n=1 Tax=Mucilaginibacter sp. TaxID=1882438 RepID=UPI0031A5D65D